MQPKPNAQDSANKNNHAMYINACELYKSSVVVYA